MSNLCPDPAPKPGIYPNVPAETYHGWDAISSSMIRKASAKSCEHLKYMLDGDPTPSSESQLVGTGLHYAVLQPDIFAEIVLPVPINPKTKKPYADLECDAVRLFQAQNPGRLVLAEKHLIDIAGMKQRLLSRNWFRRLLAAPGEVEVAVVWDDPETGLRCKARLDKYAAGSLGVELKTAQDASIQGVERALATWGYAQQVVWYSDGFQAISGKETAFTMVFVENEPPYSPGPPYIIEEAETWGVARQMNREALDRIAACYKSKIWPGYGEEVTAVGLPKWKLSQYVEGF